MAEKRSEKCCFESGYGGGWVTPPARLAEMACERIAGENVLGDRFWQKEPWKAIFLREMALANRLLKTPFAVKAIVKAWHSREAKRVNTLGAPFFKPYIEKEQRSLDMEANRLENSSSPEPVNTLEKPRPIQRSGRSIREKLEDNGPTTETS